MAGASVAVVAVSPSVSTVVAEAVVVAGAVVVAAAVVVVLSEPVSASRRAMPPTATPSARTAAQRSAPEFSRALAGTRYGIVSRWIGPLCSKFIEDGVTSSHGASSPRWLGAPPSSASYSPVAGSASSSSRSAAATSGLGSGPARGCRICRSPVRTVAASCGRSSGAFASSAEIRAARPVGRFGRRVADRRRLVADVARGDVGEAAAAEGRPSGEHLVEHDAQRVQVGARVDLATQRLFRRDVLARPEHAAGLRQTRLLQRTGDPEIGHAHPAVVADQDVAGLQIAVDAAPRVGGGEAVRDLRRDRDRVGDRDHPLLPEALPQIGAVDQLEHEVRAAVHVAAIEQLDGVRARDPLEDAGLAIEPGERLGRLGGVEVQQLDGDLAARLLVGCAPDRGRATESQALLERIAPTDDLANHPAQSSGSGLAAVRSAAGSEVERQDVIVLERLDEAVDLGPHVVARDALQRVDQRVGRRVQHVVERSTDSWSKVLRLRHSHAGQRSSSSQRSDSASRQSIG